ncbi:MAG: ABC transporter ATP-binding protein [Bacteroidota bacterium]|nr:ABC transporter ATP-binding protein [Bacteroidota bacterium]MXW13390.1 ABC transporter ATP-binding protein [Rhodothermaceae bacterium]MCY3630557.1 ABC transporter ATP-binding protein [Bacteroidota bacterium]MDE2645483.1 ABC transporter ATP-binding protein [Bacteroidota bacterium]MXW34008.1 ABC transporter ATP-binding protein [Rhodothermaceae bacterium]
MIKTTNLTKNFGSQIAVNNLNLDVKSGEIYCLLGANGAGKTTTINLLLSFLKPTSGSAYINQLNVGKNAKATKQFLAYIPENLMLYPNLTATENLKYFSGIAGKKYDSDELKGYLEESGLETDAFNKPISKFSKGMRQKVGIAIALTKEAKVLLLDEPTSGLDPKANNEFGVLLKKLKTRGVSILMATHDLFRAKEVATHIGIMKKGELIQQIVSDDISLSELEKTYLEISIS